MEFEDTREGAFQVAFEVLAQIWEISEDELFEDLVMRAARQILFIEPKIHLEKIDICLLEVLRRFYFVELIRVMETSEYQDNEWFVPTVPGRFMRFTLKDAWDRAIQDATLEDILNDRKKAKEI
jgi:hypothetical protein